MYIRNVYTILYHSVEVSEEKLKKDWKELNRGKNKNKEEENWERKEKQK